MNIIFGETDAAMISDEDSFAEVMHQLILAGQRIGFDETSMTLTWNSTMNLIMRGEP